MPRPRSKGATAEPPGSAAAFLPQQLPPISRESNTRRTSDRLFAVLSAAIRDLRLPPGTPLSETDLAQQLGVSRTPLREAIARLADVGLVQVTPQVGTRVALIRLGDVDEARFVRENLELAAFELACSDPARDVADLRHQLAAQEKAAADGDLEGFFAADEAMHERIFVMSGHAGAWQAVQRMKLQLDRLRRVSLPEPSTLRDLIKEHRLIVEALERGDLNRGQTHLRSHARRVVTYGPALRRKYPEFFAD